MGLDGLPLRDATEHLRDSPASQVHSMAAVHVTRIIQLMQATAQVAHLLLASAGDPAHHISTLRLDSYRLTDWIARSVVHS